MSWDWTDAALGAMYALPGALVTLSDPVKGLALTVGVLPPAIMGLAPTRRGRLRTITLGVLTGIPIFIGGVLAGIPVLAVVAIALLPVGAAVLAEHSPIGQVALFFSLPMVGVGLSYSAGKAVTVGALMIVGRRYAMPAFSTFLVFLLLLYSHPADAGSRLGERILETLLGVGLAYLFGLAIPALIAGERFARL